MNIKCVHLLTQPMQMREKRSRNALAWLPSFGISRTEIMNKPWHKEMPSGREAKDRPFALTPGMFGCWLAHKQAIESHLCNCDALLVCECDCLPSSDLSDFAQRVYRAANACVDGKLDVFTLGYKHNGKTIDRVGKDVIVITQFIETHCYLIPIHSRRLFEEMFAKPWDQYDYCMTVYLYDQLGCRIGAFADRPSAVQANGTSLTDGSLRSSEAHYMMVKHD